MDSLPRTVKLPFYCIAGRAVAVHSGPRHPPSLIIADTASESLEWHPMTADEPSFQPGVSDFLNAKEPSYRTLQVPNSLSEGWTYALRLNENCHLYLCLKVLSKVQSESQRDKEHCQSEGTGRGYDPTASLRVLPSTEAEN